MALPFLRLIDFASERGAAQEQLCLPFDLRCKSRLLTDLASGRQALLFLPRGRIMRGGDQLIASDGTRVEVIAAPETVAHITANDSRELTCVAYHLGNRHVAVQIGDGFLRIAVDHVLEAMVSGLGARLEHMQAPFEPEAGAYSGHDAHGHEGSDGHEGKAKIHSYIPEA